MTFGFLCSDSPWTSISVLISAASICTIYLKSRHKYLYLTLYLIDYYSYPFFIFSLFFRFHECTSTTKKEREQDHERALQSSISRNVLILNQIIITYFSDASFFIYSDVLKRGSTSGTKRWLNSLWKRKSYLLTQQKYNSLYKTNSNYAITIPLWFHSQSIKFPFP